MAAVMDRPAEQDAPGVRLVQSPYHNGSFSLYAKIGFEVRKPLVCMQGPDVEGYAVRPATPADLEDCNRLCRAVHGHDRSGDVSDAIGQSVAVVVEHSGRVTGYTTGLAFFGHSVGETSEDVKALIGSATGFGASRPGAQRRVVSVLPHSRAAYDPSNDAHDHWPYNEPAGSYLPSILY